MLLVADFRVRLTVWCLVQRRPIYLPGPKFADRGIAFSPSGDTLAVLEVRPAFYGDGAEGGVYIGHVCTTPVAVLLEALLPPGLITEAPRV